MKSQGKREEGNDRRQQLEAMAARDSLIVSNESEIKYRRVVPKRILVKHFKFA